jgi:rubrerythrin
MSQLSELLFQALETERGGIRIYETALRCARNPQLRQEWEEYLEQTRNHEQVLLDAFQKLDLDSTVETPGRQVVRHTGQALVKAMEMALAGDDPAAAELVAAESIVLAETKDHANWELIGEASRHLEGKEGKVLAAACEEVEDEEDEHLYHTAGWCRELWIQSLGLPAVLPPPEEEQEVKDAIAAARAKKSRDQMVASRKSRT